MKNLIYTLFFCFSFILIHAQESDRNAVWIHGLGGNNHSWGVYSPKFQAERRMKSHPNSFGDGNLRVCTGHVKEGIKDALGNEAQENRNILIGHSTGGLVARNLDRTQNNGAKEIEFGGMITVHSPNQGAPLANNVASGKMFDIGVGMINQIKKPIVKDPLLALGEILALEAINGIPFLSLEDVLDIIFGFMGQSTKEFFEGTVMNNFGDFAEADKIKDLSVGSQFLNDLNNYQSGIHRISVRGWESSNLFWRTISSLSNRPSTKPLHAITDESFNKHAEILSGIYRANGYFREIRGIVNDYNPLNLFTKSARRNYDMANSWFTGADYIKNGIEEDYKKVIGANNCEWKTYSVQVNVCQNTIDDIERELRSLMNNPGADPEQIQTLESWLNGLLSNPDCFRMEQRNYCIPKDDRSDGIVPYDNQAFAEADEYENRKVNHFEALNHEEMTKNFNDIWEGQRNNNFWKTEKR